MKILFGLMAGLLITLSCFAEVDTTTEAEKRYLIKIAEELSQLDKLAQQASENADPDARVNFDYVALRNDLQEIRRALEGHIQKPSRSPRKISDLELAKQQ